MKTSLSIFRANDIRGIYKKDFDLDFCKDLAQSLTTLLRKNLSVSKPKILIGHDARLSSPEISDALLKDLKNQGVQVGFVGLVPSPLCYFLLHHYDFDATIVVTASHNPPQHNGFKIVIHKKFNLPDSMSLLKNIFEKSLFVDEGSQKGSEVSIDAFTPYINSLKKEFSFSKNISFVLDMGNGALGPLAKKVFEKFKFSPHFLFTEPDGNFPNHHPDPTVEKNLISLKQEVKKRSAQFGVGFDGDGDRLVLVTNKGQTIFGDELASLFIPSVLKENKKGIVVADVKCSDWFFNFVEKQGGTIFMTKSGHSLIRQEMKKKQAAVAFEFSGHFFFNDRKDRGFDDALYALFRLLEIADKNPDFLSQIPQQNMFKTGEIRLDLSSKQAEEILENIKNYLNKKSENFITLDGIRISRQSSWALFRKSQTQEALTMRFEASSKQELLDLKKEFSVFVKIPN